MRYRTFKKTAIAAAAALFSNFAPAEPLPMLRSIDMRLQQSLSATRAPALPAEDIGITFLGEYTTAQMSSNGNLFRFESPAGYEHINVGTVLEGYLVCGTQAGQNFRHWDYFGSSSGFGASSYLPDANFSQRSTIDNRLELTQVYDFDAPLNAVVIHMKLKNKTAQNITNVVLRRQVDFDIDTGGSLGWAGFINTHEADLKDTVQAHNASARAPAGRSAHTMTLSHVDATPRSRVSRLAIVIGLIGDTSCEPKNLNGGESIRGDFGETLEYKIAALAPGQSMNVDARYTRPGADGL